MVDEGKKPATSADEIEELKRQVEAMQERLARLSAASEGGNAIEGGEIDGERASEADRDVAPEPVAESDAVPICDADELAEERGEASEGGVVVAPIGEESARAAEAMEASGASNRSDADAATETESADVAIPDGSGAQASGDGAGRSEGIPAEQVRSYEAYVPPAAPFAGQVQSPSAGSPTPPPSYGAYAQQQAAQNQQTAYARPTGQQAFQGGVGYTASQAPYSPYGQAPYQQPVVRTKDHVAAGLLGVFLGTFGIHKFYLGYNTAGFIMLGVAILGGLLSFGLATSVVWLIGLIEGIIYLVKNQPEFERAYVFAKREWF